MAIVLHRSRPDSRAACSATVVRVHAESGVSRGAVAHIATHGKAGARVSIGGVPDAILIAMRSFRVPSVAAGLVARWAATARSGTARTPLRSS